MRGRETSDGGMCMRMREQQAKEKEADTEGNKCECETERMKYVYERWTVNKKRDARRTKRCRRFSQQLLVTHSCHVK